MTIIVDEKWPVARLIPITSASGVEAQERNAASALLAVVTNVKEFGKALLRPLGAPAGVIQTFVETPFMLEGRKVRPDGLITVTRGGKSWVALVETKVGAASLEADQMHAYLDICRERGFDAVLSISNHYVTASSAYPIDVDKRRLRKVSLVHRSWVDVLTEAVVQKEHRGVSDPDQAYILGELIRYLSDPRSGVVTFNNMGPGWTKVKDGARAQTLRKTDPEVLDVASRWDDLVRYLCLHLTMELGRDVKPSVVKAESSVPARLANLKESLANQGVLYGALSVPDVVGPIDLRVDLRARQITVGTSVDAPKEGRSRGRVSWLVRQLKQAPDDTRVEARLVRSQSSLVGSLGDIRGAPEAILPPGDREIRAFHVSLARNMGLKRDASKGSFIETVLSTTEEFYRLVLQDLRPWKPSPPKLKPKEEVPEAQPQGVPAAVEAEVEVAHREKTEELPQSADSASSSFFSGGRASLDSSNEEQDEAKNP
ncbi:MAG TPA: stress response protein [Actinomycetota bacterium]|nr:stress response protein [Actinomycetota bacterium]